jgi:hypothetical protein
VSREMSRAKRRQSPSQERRATSARGQLIRLLKRMVLMRRGRGPLMVHRLARQQGLLAQGSHAAEGSRSQSGRQQPAAVKGKGRRRRMLSSLQLMTLRDLPRGANVRSKLRPSLTHPMVFR